jgi:hypothetical protein
MLKLKNSVKGDTEITFEANAHRYTVFGKQVRISVTKLAERAVPEEHRFDGAAIIKKNLRGWRSNASSKYNSLVAGVTDAQARKNIFADWSKAREAGTSMHLIFEHALNGLEPSEAGHEVEMAQFRAAMSEMDDVPFRTELSIFGVNADGDAAVAGQIDLLTKDGEGRYHIVDFKRTTNDLGPNAACFGKRFLNDCALNDHFKYSLQLALYREIFLLQTGLPIATCRLLQIHPDLDAHKFIETTDLAEEARELLRGAGVVV